MARLDEIEKRIQGKKVYATDEDMKWLTQMLKKSEEFIRKQSCACSFKQDITCERCELLKEIKGE